MRLPILLYPDPLLKEISRPIDRIDDSVRQLAADMAQTMYESEGIGLAAPQTGHALRLITVDISGPEMRQNLMTLINPELEPLGEELLVTEEGCLSVPLHYRSKVERTSRVRLRARDLDGNPVDMVAEDMLAVCLQHEVDHLNGILFLDHLSHLKRSLYRARVYKQGRQTEKAH